MTEIVDLRAAVAFIGYLAAIMVIGALAARFSSRGLAEYFIGGRRMNRFVVALSAVVSGRSAWLLLGVTGMAYTRGASAVWAIVGYTGVELFLFLSYGRRLRRFTEAYGCITVPDFFAARLGDDRGVLRVVLVAVIGVFMIAYVAAQFAAGGKAVAAGFGLSETAGVLLTAGFVLGYTLLGGFAAVSLTDTLQGIMMLLALILLPAVVIADLGGPALIGDALAALDPALLDPLALSAGAFIGFVGIGLGSPGNPHILARYMSIRSAADLRVAAAVGTGWNVLMGAGAIIIGLAGRAAFPDVAALPQADPERLYPELAAGYLPPLLFGLVRASVFAAIMSTADSQLLVAASSLVRDLYEKVLRRAAPPPERSLVAASRLAVAGLVLASLALVWTAESVIFWLVLFAWGGLGAALGPTSLLALYWHRTTGAGVIAGLVTGTATTFAWRLIEPLHAIVYEGVPGFAAGFLATVLVSALTRPPGDAREMIASMRPPR